MIKKVYYFTILFCCSGILSAQTEKMSAENYYEQANICFEQQEYDNAIKNLRRAVKQYPKSVDYHLLMAKCYYKKGNFNNIEKKCKEVISLDKRNAEAYFMLGQVYFHKKKNDMAIDMYKKAVKNDDTYVEAYLSLGKACALKGDKFSEDDALIALNRAVELDPDTYEAYIETGKIYYRRQKFEMAIEMYKNAVEIVPDNADIHLVLGDLYRRNKKYSLAVTAFEEVLNNHNLSDTSLYAYALLNIALCHKDENMLDKAENYLNQALDANPSQQTESKIYFNLGYLFARKGNYDKAIDYYGKAIKINKCYADAYYNLGNAYNMKGQTTKKLNAYKKAARNGSSLARQWLKKNNISWN